MSSLSRASRVYGNITLDGKTRKAWASRLVAYVPQFDFLLPTLTVAETLRYSALLRLPKDTQGHEVQVTCSPSAPSLRPVPSELTLWHILHGACVVLAWELCPQRVSHAKLVSLRFVCERQDMRSQGYAARCMPAPCSERSKTGSRPAVSTSLGLI